MSQADLVADSINWPEKAADLARELRFEASLKEALPPNAPRPQDWPKCWLIACSGGADSTALLLCLAGQFPEKIAAGDLKVMHFNHQTRGAESDADAAFVQEMANALGIPFHLGRCSDFRQEPEPRPEEANEDRLRSWRQAFFQRVREAVSDGARCTLFTGHHADDVAETLLMAIARGSHPYGLASNPRPFAVRADHFVVRPWLSTSKRRLIAALCELDIPWREDASNHFMSPLRNRLRHHVIPAWLEASDRDVLAGAARFRRHLEELEELETFARGTAGLPTHDCASETFDFDSVRDWPVALIRQALNAWITGHAGIEAVPAGNLGESVLRAGLCFETLDVTLTPAWRLQLKKGSASLVRADSSVSTTELCEAPVDLRPGDLRTLTTNVSIACVEVELDAARRTSVRSGRLTGEEAVQAQMAYLDADAAQALLNDRQVVFQVRPWQAGDRYRPLNAPGTATLQDLFVNRKVPQMERRRLPVVSLAGQIVWVPGLPPAHDLRILPDSRRALRLTYTAGPQPSATGL
ncbi:MAG: tRNA lysidine(34) synthetase TilS [Opitutales bacterium]